MAMKTRTINGTADTEIETEIIGEGFDQDFNPRYFAEMVNVLDDEKLIIKNGGGYQATVITNEDENILYLVLPLRR